MKANWHQLLIIIAGALLVSGCEREEINLPVPTGFGENCLKTVNSLVAFGQRYAGSIANHNQARFIAETAQSAGAAVTTDNFTALTPDGTLSMQNISAEIIGKSSNFIIVACHYDTKKLNNVTYFQGANDGASGVALLLEMIKVIKKSGIVPAYTLKFVFFDGEECINNYTETDGLWGSRRFVEKLRNSRLSADCRLAIIVDMIGDAELSVAIPSNTDRFWRGQALAVAEQMNYAGYIRAGAVEMIDDHLPFFQANIPVINLIDYEYGNANAFWHTNGDTIDKLSASSFAIMGHFMLNFIYNNEKHKKN
jgi:Zn-dependent M28 family amino/carboxypeptidase